MKSFDDFWKTLEDDDFEELSAIINEKNKSVIEKISSKESLAYQIGMTSLLSAKFLLRKYHEWITSQI